MLAAAILVVPARAAGPSVPATYPESRLTRAQALEDLALLRRALVRVHPGLHRYTPEAQLERAWRQLERAVAHGSSDLRLYRGISLLLAQVRCDHTKAEYPQAFEQYRRRHATHLPLRVRFFDGRMYVVSSDPAQAPLPRGSEIEALDGVPVARLLRTLLPAVSVDGFTDFVKPHKLAADGDLMGSGLDHLLPIFQGLRSTFRLRLRDPGARRSRELVRHALTYDEWAALPWPATVVGAEFHTTTTWRLLDARSAYLRIETFVNYRHPVDPDDVYAPIFEALRTRGIEHLIVDLRDNGGGSNDAQIGLARYLLEEPFVFAKPSRLRAVRYDDLPRYIQTWGDPKQIFERPLEQFALLPDGWYEEREQPDAQRVTLAPERFRGRVTVLIGPRNASGTTMLVAKLKDEGRVRLVGSATGGSAEGPTAGQIFFLKLPHSGITVRLPVKRAFTQVATFRAGYGVNPDLAVPTTLADFLAGRDRVLEVAQSTP